MGWSTDADAPYARSLLFVPGSRPDRFAKAAAAGADIVCVDLEDAVAPDLKDRARADGLAWLSQSGAAAAPAIRINGLGTIAGLRDLTGVAEAAPKRGLVFLPKVASAAEVRLADSVLTEAGADVCLMALIESVEGLEQVHEIASASPRLALLMFGAADLAAELGVEIAHEPLLYARARVVHAAKRAGLGVLDVPSLDFRDPAAVEAEAVRALHLGFTGKAALHPGNVATINTVFTPTTEQVADATRIVRAYEASETGLAVIDGKLVEAPVVRAMQRVLAIADRMQRHGDGHDREEEGA